MRTNFSWLLGSATIACAAVGSVVATLWLLGLNPNGTESTVLQAGPDSRPAVFRAEALPRPRQTVPKRKPTVAHRPRAAALPVRVQPALVRRVVAPAPVHAAPAAQAPHVAIWPHVVVDAPVLAPEPARLPAPVLPTSPAAPQAVSTTPAVPNPPASTVPQPTMPVPPPDAPEAQLAAVASVQTGAKKSTGKADKTVVPPRKPGPQPTSTPGPVRPTPHEGDHGSGGSSTPKLDSSEQRAKGDRHDKHGGG
jgi:hypothetical protein